MRIVKEYDVRKNELLDTAERLFITRGFQQTTINDIREEIGIAKGTFYHYFKSKDEILDAIIERIIEDDLVRAKEIAQDETLSPPQKLYHILLSQRPSEGGSKDNITKTIHKPENAEMHLKTIVGAIKHLCPVMAEVVSQGVATGDFHTENSKEVMNILVVSGQMLFDTAIFGWTPEEKANLIRAFISSMELLLGAEKGSFNFIYEVLEHE